MTMLTHARGPFQQVHRSSGRRDTVETGAADARLATIKQFCMCAFTILLAVGAVAGVIALKAAVILSRLNLHY